MPAKDRDIYMLRLGLGPKLFQVETAVSPQAQLRGLSGRETLPPGTGMLFLFEELKIHSMWMPDMRFPLDIVWLDENLTVVHITENCPPCPERDPKVCPSYSSQRMAKYAIEMTAGEAASYGFTPGLSLRVAY